MNFLCLEIDLTQFQGKIFQDEVKILRNRDYLELHERLQDAKLEERVKKIKHENALGKENF